MISRPMKSPTRSHPTPAAPLAEKWAWAEREAGQRGDQGRWVAWSFDRSLPANTQVLEDSDGWDTDELSRQPLGRLLFGADYRPPPRGAGAVRQPIVVLLHLRGGTIDRVAVRSAALGIDLRDPVYWLGRTAQPQSFDWLAARAEGMPTTTLEAVTVEAISLHEDSERVVPYLERVIRSGRSLVLSTTMTRTRKYRPMMAQSSVPRVVMEFVLNRRAL
jgi:hypothetical protein